MSGIAVQFGAGNIGRGFTAQLFHEAGLEVVFVDVAVDLLQTINNRGEYTIHIVGPGAEEVRIDNIRAIDSRNSEEVAEAIAHSEIVCTAVGAGVLPKIAGNLASGLSRRYREGGGPLNILICENLHDANEKLRRYVGNEFADSDRGAILSQTGLVQAVVSRMVPLQSGSSHAPLDIRVEAYKRLPVDGRAIVGELPRIPGLEPVENFEAHVERKLYTHNCAHATLGYLGYLKGIRFGYEALKNRDVLSQLFGVLQETGKALVRKHAFDPQEHVALVDDLLARFANCELGDTCFRLARDPVRKLAPDDRLVGAARLCESQGVEPKELARVIAVALKFDATEDPVAVELQRRMGDDGVEVVMEAVCGIRPDEPLGDCVLREYRALSAKHEE